MVPASFLAIWYSFQRECGAPHPAWCCVVGCGIAIPSISHKRISPEDDGGAVQGNSGDSKWREGNQAQPAFFNRNPAGRHVARRLDPGLWIPRAPGIGGLAIRMAFGGLFYPPPYQKISL
jgi:hypothetical protein